MTTEPTQPKKKRPKTLPKVLDRADIQKILAVPNVNTWTGLRNRVILQVMWRAGLRVSEITNLMVANVDIEKGFLFIQQSKNNVDRTVPIDNDTIIWLKRWMDIRLETEWFFSTSKKTELNTRYVREMVYRTSKKAGVYLQNGHNKSKVHPHTFRSCYATELLEEGNFNIREVQELLGHSNIQTTVIYTQVRPAVLAAKIRQRV